jgi:hypothetical protein
MLYNTSRLCEPNQTMSLILKLPDAAQYVLPMGAQILYSLWTPSLLLFKAQLTISQTQQLTLTTIYKTKTSKSLFIGLVIEVVKYYTV